MISEFAKEKVFWTRKMNLKLVKFIESRPNIWNPKHPKYTSTKYRDKTYAEFASKYGNEFTGQAVKDRWTNIRSTFANYLRKLNSSRANPDGEEYKVNWHLWEACQFLLKVQKKTPNETTDACNKEDEDDCSEFMEVLKTQWDKLHSKKNVFRYKIHNLLEKHVNGYLLQLNPDRGSNRRTPEQIDNICQPFNCNKFNFTKVSSREILFNLVDDDESEIHSLLVNVSPISRYHSLLCPFVNKCYPQVANEASIELAINIMFIAQDRDLRIGFNSLCALASVNHLHYHLLIEKHTLPVETINCKHVIKSLYRLDEKYPVPAFCFEVPTKFCINHISKDVHRLLQYFLENSIAHNMMITRGLSVQEGGDKQEVVRVVVWPRKSSSGVKELTAFNVAVCELSGWFPIFNIEDYNNLQTEDLENELVKWRIENFDSLCDQLKSLF